MWVTAVRVEYTLNGQNWLKIRPPQGKADGNNTEWFRAN
jgi:hypothetical protein